MRTNLLVSVERPEDLGGIEEMRIVQNPNRGLVSNYFLSCKQ